MSAHQSVSQFRQHEDEAAFDIGEFFFSRTDDRGVIASGNEVFKRVSGYEWSELVNAPHKIIRHPDMPKGVFHILWERIQKGIPTGAYVKNRSKDGRYYWVYAVISPVKGGYLSTRIKPTSHILATVKATYATILAAEKEKGLTPEQSAELVRETLAKSGFDSYSAFSSYAIANEVSARDKALGRRLDGRINHLKAMLEPLGALCEEQAQLMTNFEAIRNIPSNMRIIASRLEPAGGPISAISQNYRLMSNEVHGHLDSFLTGSKSGEATSRILNKVYSALFMIGCARIQREAAECFTAESHVDDGYCDHEVEHEYLQTLLDQYSLAAGRELTSVIAEVTRMVRASKELRQLVTGLDSIRVLCRVEAGRLGSQSATLMPVIEQLDRFHKMIDHNLERIHDVAQEVGGYVEQALPRASLRRSLMYEGLND